MGCDARLLPICRFTRDRLDVGGFALFVVSLAFGECFRFGRQFAVCCAGVSSTVADQLQEATTRCSTCWRRWLQGRVWQ